MSFFGFFKKQKEISFQILDGSYRKTEASAILNATSISTFPTEKDFKSMIVYGYYWGLDGEEIEMFLVSNSKVFKCFHPDLKRAKIILIPNKDS